jgi:hypothetical protein
MSLSSAANCGRCGAALAGGTGASAGSRCPLCGEPLDPDATWRPGSAPPALARVDLPARVPVGPLALLAVVCAVMGLALGIWLGWGRGAPARRAEVSLPPLPPPGPPVARPLPARQFYPPPQATNTGLALPPARIRPPAWGGG